MCRQVIDRSSHWVQTAPITKMSVEKPMKKLLLASAIAALSVSAQAAPQVYGKAFLTVDVRDGDTEYTNVEYDSLEDEVVTKSGKRSTDGRSKLNSNASRIGIKGSEALTANTDLIYQLEYRVEVDHETGSNDRNFEARDTYLGLANKQYGTLLAGRLTAIDAMVDYANVTVGSPLGGDNVLAVLDGERANNAFAYVSPSYNGVNFLGMYVMDENTSQDNLERDVWGVGAQFAPANAPYRAGTTYLQGGDLKAVRVSGAYDITPATTIGALYQSTKLSKNAKRENAFTLSAEHKVAQTPWTAYGQVDIVDKAEGFKDGEKQRLVLGTKYAFNKATTGHIYASYLKTEGVLEEFDLTEDGARDSFATKYGYGLDASTTTVVQTKNKFDGFGIGAGIEYKF